MPDLADVLLRQALAELPASWPAPPQQARRLLEGWLDAALERCDDELFARRFARSCPVPGAPSEAYLHRVLDGDAEEPTLLAGVRFKGGDVAQPFVDLLAWDRPVGDWAAVGRRILAAYRPFSPRWIRLRWPGASRPAVPGAVEVDQRVLAERLDRLRRRPRPWGEVSLDLAVAHDLDWVEDFHAAWQRWRAEAGPVGREVYPASERDLGACLETGAIVVARHNGRWAGVAAAQRQPERALDGFCVCELFLDAPLRGRRRAPVLQRRLIDALPDTGRMALHGTIHRLNAPSLKTAQRCGRRVVETWWFWTPDAGRG